MPNDPGISRWQHWATLALMVILSGCQQHQYLVGTPNLWLHQEPQHVYAGCPKECQSSVATVLYATDRTAQSSDAKEPKYGYGRATSLAFGVASVKLNPDPTWEELVKESTLAKRGREYELQLASVREQGHLKPFIEHVQVAGQGPAISQTSVRQDVQELNDFQRLLRGRLAQAAQKDVYIFVHGFNNTFEDAAFRAAEVWHFLGRVGVPIAYSWPAGRGGLRGYAYDRESGEFSVSHLRYFIKTVAECPDVERVHLIAHSRGCDVTVSALRELNLAYQAQGKSTQQELKLENLVLAAPDIDEDVFMQRFVAENLLRAARRTTIYASRIDRAIEAADWIFASRQRLGTLAVKDVSPKVRQRLATLSQVQFIECKLSTSWTAFNHDYVFSHPAALSDLILLLRDRRPPGAENGRPLLQPAAGFWELTEDYLKSSQSPP